MPAAVTRSVTAAVSRTLATAGARPRVVARAVAVFVHVAGAISIAGSGVVAYAVTVFVHKTETAGSTPCALIALGNRSSPVGISVAKPKAGLATVAQAVAVFVHEIRAERMAALSKRREPARESGTRCMNAAVIAYAVAVSVGERIARAVAICASA